MISAYQQRFPNIVHEAYGACNTTFSVQAVNQQEKGLCERSTFVELVPSALQFLVERFVCHRQHCIKHDVHSLLLYPMAAQGYTTI